MAGAAEPRPIRRRRAALIAVGLTIVAAGTALVAGAQAERPSGRYQGTLDALVAFLQRDQNEDGGFGSEAGAPSSPLFSAWVALALAAAGVNPHDQRNKTVAGAKDVYTYLAEHAGGLEKTTDFERELMVANTADYPPVPFGGVNLVEKVLQGRIPGTGTFSHELDSSPAGMNDTIFAVLALAPIKEPAIEAVVHEAAEWVEKEQNENGSWPSTCPKSQCTHAGVEPPGDTDMTGAGLEALNAAGFHDTEAQAKALAYLHEAQLPDGGWPQEISERESESNVGSTAWVVQGIWAAGGNPETWVIDGNEPLGYMASLQQRDGHIKYEQSHDDNGVWMTAYAGPALAGVPLPIPYAPREVPSESEEENSAETTPTASGKPVFVERTKNEGGDGVVQGEGVDAGRRRGRRAGVQPAEAAEQGQDAGRRPRRPRQRLEARDHSQTRRGANQHQARGTEKVEPRKRSKPTRKSRR